MNTVKCFRIYEDDKQTLGLWSAVIDKAMFVAKTLELPNKQNANNVSRILAGKYICKYTQSASLKDRDNNPLKTYEITNVPGRAGVRIHSANYFSELRGCISLGDAHKDINADGNLDLIHSGDTVKNFEQFMGYKDFILEILDCEK